jgi:hypothetical protein
MKLPISLMLLTSLTAGCAQDEFQAGPPAEAGALGVDVNAPLGRPSCAAPVRVSPPLAGFAGGAWGELVAFDPLTGQELARHALGSEIIDLQWDGRTRRLLVVSAERFDVEGSRVHALGFDAARFVHEASSDVFAGELRLIVTPARVLAVGGELSAEWWELDDQLGVVGASAGLPLPDMVAEPDAGSVLSLRREALADVVQRVSGFAAGWSSAELALPRAEPERALAIAGSRTDLWLLRQGAPGGGLELAALERASFPPPTAPAFRPLSAACNAGRARAFGADDAGCALVGVVGAAADELVLAPLSGDASATCATLRAPLAGRERWIARNLVVDPAGRFAWVATERGVEAFTFEPPGQPLESFTGSELGAPLALAP